MPGRVGSRFAAAARKSSNGNQRISLRACIRRTVRPKATQCLRKPDGAWNGIFLTALNLVRLSGSAAFRAGSGYEIFCATQQFLLSQVLVLLREVRLSVRGAVPGAIAIEPTVGTSKRSEKMVNFP
jgi:hypothetical protein